MSVDAPARSIVRVILIAVGVAALLYLLYLVRKPLGWLFLATFIAIALSGPVNRLHRYMKRGFAIALVYLGLFLVPILLGLVVVPPLVNGANDLANNLPRYVSDARDFVQRNDTLRNLDRDYDIFGKLQQEANKLPSRIGDAAGILRDIGFGFVNSLFALVTILILAAFMLGSGKRWVDAALDLGPPERAERIRSVLERSAQAVGNYVAGALLQATIAGVATFAVLSILGVPFAPPLAVLAGMFSLIPLVGATIAAVIIGLVTLFTSFPTATIVWVVWAIVYQQIENNVIQPQIQRRAVDIHPFAVLLAVLFGSTLLGVLGAIVAIPVAASIQIALKEWWAYRREGTAATDPALAGETPP